MVDLYPEKYGIFVREVKSNMKFIVTLRENQCKMVEKNNNRGSLEEAPALLITGSIPKILNTNAENATCIKNCFYLLRIL